MVHANWVVPILGKVCGMAFEIRYKVNLGKFFCMLKFAMFNFQLIFGARVSL